MQRVLGSMVAALALLPVLAFAQATPESTPIGSPVASPAASDIGQSVRWGEWTVTVEGAEFAEVVAPESYDPQTPHGIFLVVRLTVVNETREPAYFPDSETRARDERDRAFTTDLDATWRLVAHEEMGDGPLQPGIAYRHALVFDVAPDATGFVLVLGDSTLRLGI